MEVAPRYTLITLLKLLTCRLAPFSGGVQVKKHICSMIHSICFAPKFQQLQRGVDQLPVSQKKFQT